ncbi:hypothetical protein MMC22_002199 [Lobaria immixta]|nr:hypothetical protein [Lobaria immixta]
MFSKRHETADCVGHDCGLKDEVIPESPTIENLPVKWNFPFSSQEEPLELAVNLVAGSDEDSFSDSNKDWNNAIANGPSNDATTNIPPSARDGLLDQIEAKISNGGADDTLNNAFEIAATPKKTPAPVIEQDPTTGDPIENSCLVPPHDHQLDVYLVRLVEYKTAVAYRNPQAIFVTQYRTSLKNLYDIHPGPARHLIYRKRNNAAFFSGGKPVPLSKFEPRGWLVTLPDEPMEVALAWFESLAQSITPPPSSATPTANTHYTNVWVTRVFNAIQNSDSTYWIPI